MICFPNAKINIGLRIVEKRSDGFHNIETIFYPIHGLYDCLEFHESSVLQFENSGLHIDAPMEKNLCVKAWNLLHNECNIPPIHIFLHKNIPFGAGLGGGSADAAFLLVALNNFFSIGLSTEKLQSLALSLGSDCPFFISNSPMFAEGRGELFTPLSISLKEFYIVLANPSIHVSTAEAYGGVVPQKRSQTLLQEFSGNIKQWRGKIENDFETSVFVNHPIIADLKNSMYDMGAIYAAMSGSGSTVFGIFDKEPNVPTSIPVIWKGKLS